MGKQSSSTSRRIDHVHAMGERAKIWKLLYFVMAAALNPLDLLNGIRSLILSPRQSASRGINLLLVLLTPRLAVRLWSRNSGEQTVQNMESNCLSNWWRLTADFGNGFSRSNLEYMRRFYLTYPNRGREISQTPSGDLNVPFPLLSTSQTMSGKLIEEERRFAQCGNTVYTLLDRLAAHG